MATSTITITDGASTITLDNTVSTLTLGTSGPQGAPGEGVPVGGTTGQILAKDSATNYDTSWIDNFTTDVRKLVKNDSGGTLAKGTVVYVSGANGANVLVKAALATSDGTSATTIGILNETLANNASGYAIVEGAISGIDTSAAAAGDPVWLSGTVAGGMLYGVANKPQAPVHVVYLGTVTRSNINNGQIEISVNNGWELDELHNVLITSPTNGQVLAYNSTTQLWNNTTPSAADITAVTAGTGLTGGGTSGDVTLTVDNTKVSYDAASSLRSLPLYNQKDAAERLLAQAVFWIDAAHSSASGQTITNLGWGGSALNATAGSSGSADSNDPKFLDWTGENYIFIPGVIANYLSVPYQASFVTTDLDVRVKVALDDWTPAANGRFASRWNSSAGNNRGWIFDIDTLGRLQCILSNDGLAFNTSISSVATGFTDGATRWVRFTYRQSDRRVQFFTSTDGSTWTQLGTDQTSATTSIYASNAGIEVSGSSGGGGGNYITGNFYALQVMSGIDGTAILNIDASVVTSGAATSFTALTGQTVTINRATSGRKTCVVTNPLWLFGTDDYINVPDNDLLDFAATDSFSVVWVGRQWATATNFGTLIGKRQATSLNIGYTLRNNGTSLQNSSLVWDGTTSVADTGVAAYTTGTFNVIGMNVDRSGNTVKAFVNNTVSSGQSIAAVGTLANTGPLQIGGLGGSLYADMETVAGLVFRRILSTAELALITNYYTGRVA